LFMIMIDPAMGCFVMKELKNKKLPQWPN